MVFRCYSSRDERLVERAVQVREVHIEFVSQEEYGGGFQANLPTDLKEGRDFERLVDVDTGIQLAGYETHLVYVIPKLGRKIEKWRRRWMALVEILIAVEIFVLVLVDEKCHGQGPESAASLAKLLTGDRGGLVPRRRYRGCGARRVHNGVTMS